MLEVHPADEGASKGMLVTTSGYGKASHDLANGKPIELLDGANLLYLLREHAGLEARIQAPEDWRDPLAVEFRMRRVAGLRHRCFPEAGVVRRTSPNKRQWHRHGASLRSPASRPRRGHGRLREGADHRCG